MPDEALRTATGRGWSAWFALLDEWGAAGQGHTEIARHLVRTHDVNGWHAQSIANGYEQARGLRTPGQTREGDFQTSGNKTVNAIASRITEAFIDDDLRRQWLPDGEFTVRTARPGKSVTADWDAGTSRVSVYLVPKGRTKTQISLSHTKLPDGDSMVAYKTFWRERLAALKALLEA
jgi:hypothetical protein